MNKPTVKENLRALMESHSPPITQGELARRTRVPQPTIHRILTGESQNPRQQTLRPLCRFFGVTLAQILGDEPLPSGANHQVRDSDQDPIYAKVMQRVPLISWVQAGPFAEAADPYVVGDAADWVPVYDTVSDQAFALEVRGDSMVNPYGDPSFPPGTRIIVDPAEDPKPGRFVIARIDAANEVTFKILVEDAGQLFLKPLNPSYPLIRVNNDTRVCGVVVAIAQRKLI